MFKSRLARLAARKGWQVEESYVYRGEWNGCQTSLIDGEGFVEVVLALPSLSASGEDWDALTHVVDGYSGLRIIRRELRDGFFAVRIRRRLFSQGALIDGLDLFLNILTEEARERGLLEPAVCVVCGLETQETGSFFDLACHIHPACRLEAGDDLPAYPPYLRYEDSGKDPFRSLKTK